MINNKLRIHMTETEKAQFDREFTFKSFMVRLLNDRIGVSTETDVKTAVSDILTEFEDEIDTCEVMCNVSNDLTNVVIADYLDDFDKQEWQSTLKIKPNFDNVLAAEGFKRLTSIKIFESIILNILNKSLDINNIQYHEIQPLAHKSLLLYDEKIDALIRSLEIDNISKNISIAQTIAKFTVENCKSTAYDKSELKAEAEPQSDNTEALIKKAIESVINKNIKLSGMDVSISFEGKFTIDIKSK